MALSARPVPHVLRVLQSPWAVQKQILDGCEDWAKLTPIPGLPPAPLAGGQGAAGPWRLVDAGECQHPAFRFPIQHHVPV